MTFSPESNGLSLLKEQTTPTPLPPPIPQHIVAEIESESFFIPRHNFYLAICTIMLAANLVLFTLIWLKI